MFNNILELGVLDYSEDSFFKFQDYNDTSFLIYDYKVSFKQFNKDMAKYLEQQLAKEFDDIIINEKEIKIDINDYVTIWYKNNDDFFIFLNNDVYSWLNDFNIIQKLNNLSYCIIMTYFYL